MCLVKANATFHGHKLTDIPVLNPGDWFGKPGDVSQSVQERTPAVMV